MLVSVLDGMVTVTPYLAPGVTLKPGIMTYYSDIDAVKSIRRSQLGKVNVKFSVPVDVAKRFRTNDPYVLLYINCPVSHKAKLPNMFPFSFLDQGYLERVEALTALMD